MGNVLVFIPALCIFAFVVFACFAISKILKKFNVNPFIPVGIIVIASSIYLFIFLVQALMIKKGWV